jgi:peroxiredoxin Q/BCP
MGMKVSLVVGAAIVALALIFFSNNVIGSTNSASGVLGSSAYPYQVGSPGPGADELPIQLPSTKSGIFDLSTQTNNTVLLFFMEGVGCEPCWTQIKDIEKQWSKFRALGIDEMVTITTNTIPQLKQKAADEGIRTPVLSDIDFYVSHAYNANKYGMMGDQMDGHTFIVVGKGGLIRWRADYGGSPKYIMYLPVPALLHDVRKGLHGRAA